MASSDTPAAEINALRFAALLFPKEITGMEITCAELSGGQASLGGTSGSARPGRDAGRLLGPIPPRLSAKPDQNFSKFQAADLEMSSRGFRLRWSLLGRIC